MSPNETSTPSVILVHGGWADGSSWSRVISELQEAHVEVTAAPIPLTSLDDDVAALDRAIDRTEGPVVLAGHAYAGAVITATMHPRVEALVFVAALAPDEGETVGDVFYRDPAHPDAPDLAPDDDGLLWLPANAFGAAFAQCASAQQHALLAAVQRPLAVRCIQQALRAPRWKDLPCWYLVAEQDRMINPTTQKFMAERMGARTHNHDVDHTPLVTQSRAVTDIISEALSSVAAS
jgi:pimeloyl-ACP methyl ester carboxylesterase